MRCPSGWLLFSRRPGSHLCDKYKQKHKKNRVVNGREISMSISTRRETFSFLVLVLSHACAYLIRELKQTRSRRQARTSSENVTSQFAIIFLNHPKAIVLAKCVPTLLELNWNKRFRDKQTKLNICHHMLTSSTQLQNRSFHVVERTRTSAKCPKMKNARAKPAKLLFFVVKYANLWRSCCSCRRGCLSSLISPQRLQERHKFACWINKISHFCTL